jgi:hypothetical protein
VGGDSLGEKKILETRFNAGFQVKAAVNQVVLRGGRGWLVFVRRKKFLHRMPW